jgi:hypothetical protein
MARQMSVVYRRTVYWKDIRSEALAQVKAPRKAR